MKVKEEVMVMEKAKVTAEKEKANTAMAVTEGLTSRWMQFRRRLSSAPGTS